MRHVYWIIDNLLAGRPGPLMKPWNPEELHAGGIRALVSLAPEDGVPDLSGLGFEHYRAPLPPVILFSRGMRKAFVHEALPVWSFIHEKVTSGVPMLVHCHAGKDRTGVVLAGYLIMYRGFSAPRALAHLRQAKPDAMTAPGYAEVLDLLTPGERPDPRTLL